MPDNFFELIHQDNNSLARAGVINTDHGSIMTPVFMPVGTAGTVKAIEQRQLVELRAKIILGNTYHLYLRPGERILHDFGGLHKFMNWDGAILTDSGGYQIFSLKDIRKISESGAEFSSHIDGSKHLFTPESVIATQRYFGSDIMMVLDECTPYPANEEYAQKSMEMSLRWAQRAKSAFVNSESLYSHRQYLFGIGQGSMYKRLRSENIEKMVEIGFDGYALGGLSVGEPADVMYDIVEYCTPLMPERNPRYLMGVGTPENILDCIERGIDMFDCVMPTRNARNGQLFTTRGKINIRNAIYKNSKETIDPNLGNYVSQNYTLGYLRHLITSDEILGLMIASQQNIAFYMWLITTAREKILSNNFVRWKREFLQEYSAYNKAEKK